ncbi:hypothetical protein [Actinokineospora cianjurensis]|uniref:Uncharacterized protein n=1 Tax=Actinokineospora cianjurensis TaxID=585224 RepID=A0A421B9W1_9PSEU|nr:hypothetical protein [Actinokineospora cianjurensis]RLK61119.1 hypothetical protein CLV68_1634 [Actinokineospora cianjurensis]
MPTLEVVARDPLADDHPDCATHHLVLSLRGRVYPIACPTDPDARDFLRQMAEATDQCRAERTDFAITMLAMSVVLPGILLLYWAVAPEVLPSIGVIAAVPFVAEYVAQFRKRRNS